MDVQRTCLVIAVSSGAQTKEGGWLGLLMSFGHAYKWLSPLEPNYPKTGSYFSPVPKDVRRTYQLIGVS
jgi:hypothetical protein